MGKISAALSIALILCAQGKAVRAGETTYVMPRRNGQTLRDYLRAATEAKADFVMVTSWNEWPETTVVEPSSTWPDPYHYLKILAEWKGRAFRAPETPRPARRNEQLPTANSQ